jgi:L-aminopeptidase/D-esterase-like protein
MARARAIGVPLDGTPGQHNAITDVAGVEVGHSTIIRGEGPLVVGQGPARTGVTALLPRGRSGDPVFAGWYALNGNGEMTGTTWVEESGFLEGPLLTTNTHSVGVVRDAAVAWMIERRMYSPLEPAEEEIFWLMPVVAETYDGWLSDINGFHVRPEHVREALDGARGGPVAEGGVGGGTGMICHGFKGGIGTASRVLPAEQGGHTVGALVQANHGARADLTIAGVPVGRLLAEEERAVRRDGDTGSIIVAIATDAPLLPHQLKRVARRVPAGIGRVGGYGSNTSGDIFIAFSTANPGAHSRTSPPPLAMLPNDRISPIFLATVQAVEEAILNALVAAEPMVGVSGRRVAALPHGRVRELLAAHGRLGA